MAELANILGITTGALRNIACNHVTSLRTRQAITNIIGNQIWRGVSVTKRTFILREKTEIEFVDDPDTARDFEREFPGKTRRRGARIKITGAVCGDFCNPDGSPLRVDLADQSPALESKPEAAKASWL